MTKKEKKINKIYWVFFSSVIFSFNQNAGLKKPQKKKKKIVKKF